MAHDGFLAAFHELQVPPSHTLAGAGGWDHDAPMSPLLGSHEEAVLMEQLVTSWLGVPASRYGSCYRTPLGSPSSSNPVAAPVNSARLSCFADELSRVASSSHSLLAEHTPPSPPGGVAPHGIGDGSTSDDAPSRKRKAAPAGRKSKANNKEAAITATAKSPEAAERRVKRSKLSADVGEDDEDPKHGNGRGKEIVAEPARDYIHVRARRGQATDSHSLAERVRREKIGERMKLLQDIVPGCSKVTGKAVMLDEIINYVQSLQRQVEFMSTKLSTVNPRLEVDVDSFVQKDANQSACVPAAPTPLPPPAYSNTAFCYASPPAPEAAQSPVTTYTKALEPPSSFVSHGIQDHSLDGFQNPNAQIGNPWEDDLQSLVQMGFRGNT